MARRKLTAIMFTDISGYSSMMSENEEKALKLLHDHDEILQKVILKHEGQIIKKMGDAVFASFGSTLEAFQAAEEIQQELKKYNETRPENEKIFIRIGLHAGDVVEEENDLYGDGVNIAARLEPLADPGGICLSESVYLSLRSSVQTNAEKTESVELKNIAQRINIYRVPSVYGSEFRSSTPLRNPGQKSLHYNIKDIRLLPASSFGWMESVLVSIMALLAFDIFGALVVSLASKKLIFNFFFYLNNPWLVFILFNVIAVIALSITIKIRSIRVNFEDIRDVDRVIQFILDHVGFRKVNSRGDHLIFKPSSYNRIFWFARNMKVVVDGNSILIKGTDLLVRRVEKVLKTYQSN